MVGLGLKSMAGEAMGNVAGTMEGNMPSISVMAIIGGILMFLVTLLFLFFSLALQTKRWHDRGKPGWWFLIGFIPVVGVWGFIECGFLEGTVGPNKYGPDPLGRK